MAIDWAITFPDWSLDSIYEADDVNRLRQVFQNVKQLAGESQAIELAFKSLYRTAVMGEARKCSGWLASIAVNYTSPSLNLPAIHVAVRDEKFYAVEYLLPHSPRNQIVGTSHEGLMCACRINLLEMIETVLPHCNVDRATDLGETALMAATTRGTAALRVLLPLANRAKRDREGLNALMHAIRHGNEEALALLLPDASDAEIHSKKAGGQSAWEFAKEVQEAIRQGLWWGVPSLKFRPLVMIEAELARRMGEQVRDAATAGQAKRGADSATNGRRPLRL